MHPDEKLTAAERAVISASIMGATLDMRAGKTGMNDPARGAVWSAGRTVSAGFLAALVSGRFVPESGHPRAVKLMGARIGGPLELVADKLVCILELRDCFFAESINLYGATAPYVGFPGCHVPELIADHIETTLNLDLSCGFTSSGGVSLSSAKIGGNLQLDGARISADEHGRALVADGIQVTQNVFCRDGFTAEGQFRLPGAVIGGTLDLGSARLVNPGGAALVGDSLVIKLDLRAGENFSAQGEFRLPDAAIGGQLVLNAAHLANPDGPALRGTGMTVQRDLLANEGFTAEGAVGLGHAHIGGKCDFGGARLSFTRGNALHADSLRVDKTLICDNGFTAEGGIRLVGARVGGQFNLSGAHLDGLAGFALAADRLEAGLDVLARDGFTAHGEVRLPGAHIGGDLDFRDSTLNAPERTALLIDGASISGGLHMPKQAPQGEVSLSNATVGTFWDAPEGWPTSLHLSGFAYETLGNDEVGVKDRLRWLTASADSHSPQVYNQLAAAYKRTGQDEAARTVMIVKQRHRRATLNPAGKIVSLVLDWTVGYGYRTWKAGIWLAALVSFSAWAFTQIPMVATAQHPPAFNPFGYAIDVLLPIADLGFRSDWQPSGGYLYLAWLLQGMGWILTTAVVAAVTGVLKRDD